MAAEHLAERLATDADLRQALDAQGVASTLNALSKWPTAANCCLAAELLAGQLLRDPALWQAMNAQEFASTLSA
ncbi:hypothetical protein ACO2WH_26740, partial [Escherichia coli]|uniref:hypothetical protein n=1 Tax=Escherichia coli TaxID=562 RepID=UPI003C0B5C30